MVQISVGYIIY